MGAISNILVVEIVAAVDEVVRVAAEEQKEAVQEEDAEEDSKVDAVEEEIFRKISDFKIVKCIDVVTIIVLLYVYT